MNQPLFSIIIPTRERHQTLPYAIQTALNQSYGNFELIIMDNCSSEETYQAVSQFDDHRIKYFRSPERLSMSDNWELALSKVEGEYINILGDDDGLIPEALEIAFNYLHNDNSNIVTWFRWPYYWDNAIQPENRNSLYVNLINKNYLFNSKEQLKLVYQGTLPYNCLPMIYSSFIPQKLIKKIKAIHGKYFADQCISPDIFSGIVNAYFSDTYLFSEICLSVSGISAYSNGISSAFPDLDSKASNQFLDEIKNKNQQFIHPDLINCDNKVIGITSDKLYAKDLFFSEDEEITLNIDYVINQMISRLNHNPSKYEVEKINIEKLAQKWLVDLSQYQFPEPIPVVKDQRNIQPYEGLIKNAEGVIIRVIVNCKRFDILDVSEAVILASGIMQHKIPYLNSSGEYYLNKNIVREYVNNFPHKNEQIDDYKDTYQLTTPVAFLVFNRPENTARVFEAIREAKPPKLLVVADGARVDQEGEAKKCDQVRAIINQVDWECEVLTNYSDVNLGCRKRISSGLDWVFEQVETAIILEDDCLPHRTFFRYCQELLEKYADDERIMMISGDNFQFGQNKIDDSYYFSRYGHVWGWATWRRAWTKYDDSMPDWEELKNSSWLDDIFHNQQAVDYWSRVFQGMYDGFNTWDYIWVFTLWKYKGLCILPQVNLVSNIGFGSGTHTTALNSPMANMKAEAIKFPLLHPTIIARNIDADNFTEETQFSQAILPSSKINISPEKCKVCDSDSHYFATAKMLQKYDVNYFQCSNCGFVQTEYPYWLEEAYSDAIAVSDVGLVYRNNMMASITAKLLFNYFDHEGKFLDYGGGYGLFVRLMRDQGFDFYWLDKFCNNIFATGFELTEKEKSQLLLVTAFELFEHFTYPQQELEELIQLAPNILFSTSLLPPNNPKPDQWWYYTPHEGQHISIYTKKSLEILAAKYNLKLYTDGSSLHLLSQNKNLPENLFEAIKINELPPSQKDSLLSRDFNQVVNKLLSQNNNFNIDEYVNIPTPKSPIIVIDGVFFQLYRTGIARVWRSLFQQWANTDFAEHILVLDRANSAPKIPGIRYRTIPAYHYHNTESDRQMLQQVCEEEEAELFISTYYTTPIDTPSVFMAYDMIPEMLGGDLNQPMWREKHKGINHASAFIAISENTAKDINKCFPEIPLESITVAHCGVDSLFSPTSEKEINSFKYKYGINKPYFLIGGLGGYKNSILFFQALAQLANKQSFDIVATGAGNQLPPEWRQYTAGCTFHGLQLSDEELRLVYAGAVALVYPSKYEGFGMPVIEAMACGCPVITTPNASLPEAGGKAVIYVADDDIEAMANALCDVQKPSLRRSLIPAGLQQSQKFSWATMAQKVSQALLDNIQPAFNLSQINYIIFPYWSTDEETLAMELMAVIKQLVTQVKDQTITLLIDSTETNSEELELMLSGITMNLMLEEGIEIPETLQISTIEKLTENQRQSLWPQITARIRLTQENPESIAKFQGDDLICLNFDGDNYIIFPNWQIDEEILGLELMNVIEKLAIEKQSISPALLIDTTGISVEEANIFLSSVAINLMLEVEINIAETLQISLLGELSEIQWQSLLPQITARIQLENEDQEALIKVSKSNLPILELVDN